MNKLNFWITNNMADETKLWYIVRGLGYRRFSTLAHHSQVTWKKQNGVHDEDIIRPPSVMRRYSAACQWSIMDADRVAGVCPRGDSLLAADYYGAIFEGDSHRVNTLTIKYVRQVLPSKTLLLSSPCL